MRGTSVHILRRQYVFSKTNENKMLDKEALMGEVVELESGIEPLSIIFINISRHLNKIYYNCNNNNNDCHHCILILFDPCMLFYANGGLGAHSVPLQRL